jgi:hypothetical protein
MKRWSLVVVIVGLVLAGCSFQNKYEREAESITRAVANNDLRPVKDDIAPNIPITRTQVAQWADELALQGKLVSVKEAATCAVGWHCFDVKFEKRAYVEHMRLDDNGKVNGWDFKIAPAPAPAAT